MRTLALYAAIAIASSVCVASPVSAQSPVEEAERAYERGRFRDAIEVGRRTLESERLEEPALARLLELEALSHHALGDADGMARALAWLAALRRSPGLSASAPPPVVAAYAHARERAMQVDLAIVEGGGRRRVELIVANAPEGFVRERHLRVRFDGGPWIDGSERIEVPSGARNVQGYAWVVGPAHVDTHAIGSAERPLPLSGLPAVPAPEEPPASGSDDTLLWGLVTGGIVAVVIGAAIAIGFALAPADDTILILRSP